MLIYNETCVENGITTVCVANKHKSDYNNDDDTNYKDYLCGSILIENNFSMGLMAFGDGVFFVFYLIRDIVRVLRICAI